MNKRQYQVTIKQVAKFERALFQLAREEEGIHPRVREAQRAAIRSQLQELRSALMKYESRRDLKRKGKKWFRA